MTTQQHPAVRVHMLMHIRKGARETWATTGGRGMSFPVAGQQDEEWKEMAGKGPLSIDI